MSAENTHDGTHLCDRMKPMMLHIPCRKPDCDREPEQGSLFCFLHWKRRAGPRFRVSTNLNPPVDRVERVSIHDTYDGLCVMITDVRRDDRIKQFDQVYFSVADALEDAREEFGATLGWQPDYELVQGSRSPEEHA